MFRTVGYSTGQTLFLISLKVTEPRDFSDFRSFGVALDFEVTYTFWKEICHIERHFENVLPRAIDW